MTTREDAIIKELERVTVGGAPATDHYKMTLVLEALTILLKRQHAAGGPLTKEKP